MSAFPDRFARSQEHNVELPRMGDDKPLAVVRDELRWEGFTLSDDKLHRLGAFGIESYRDGKTYLLSGASIEDLRYVLQIERSCMLQRDHDGLALELAYRGYHSIPWERVHESAQKRVAIILTEVDRELHRANDWNVAGFHHRRIPHLARQIARKVITRQKVAQDPSSAFARDLLEKVFNMLLPVVYNNELFAERDLRGLLLALGLPEKSALEQAAPIVALLNLGASFLRIGFDNMLRQMVAKPAAAPEIKEACATMRGLSSLAKSFSKHTGIYVAPPIDYPNLEDDLTRARVDAALHNFYYSFAYGVNRDEAMNKRLHEYISGDSADFETAAANLGKIISQLSVLMRLDNEIK